MRGVVSTVGSCVAFLGARGFGCVQILSGLDFVETWDF